MDKQITFEKYRLIDLVIFSVFSVFFEAVGAFAGGKLFTNELYSISVSYIIIAIVMMRWGFAAVISAVLGGLTYCLTIFLITAEFSVSVLVIYTLGNVICVLCVVPLMRVFGKDRIKNNWLFTLAYIVLIYLVICFGRTLVGLFFSNSIRFFFNFIFKDIISLLFSVVVIMIVRLLDGVLEDQKSYLFRLEKEKAEGHN